MSVNNTMITLRQWVEMFKEGKFENRDTNTQIEAGWYDWFCRDTSLVNKTKRMGNIIKQIKDGGKVNLDESFVWFKNSCPLSGPLYDEFRIANIKDGETRFTVQIGSPWSNKRYSVLSVDNSFSEAVFETNFSRELVKWFNNEI